MIEGMELFNFQSWKSASIPFHPGVNVIIGVTDSGKSALFRAMRWTLSNPSGSESKIRSWWGGDTECRIYGRGFDVSRVRKSSFNGYRDHISGEEYNCVGNSVPAQVSKLVNMDDYLNFQGQHDSHFLVADSGGDVVKTLNRVVDLEEIDRTISAINSIKLENARTIKETETRELELLEKLKDFENLDEAAELVGIVEKLNRKLEGDKAQEILLRDVLQKIKIHSQACEEWGDKIKQIGSLKPIHNSIAIMGSLLDKQENIRTLLAGIHKAQKSIEEIGRGVKAAVALFPLLTEKKSEWEASVKRDSEIFNCVNAVNRLRDKIFSIGEDIERNKLLLKTEFKAKICPTCGQEIREGNT